MTESRAAQPGADQGADAGATETPRETSPSETTNRSSSTRRSRSRMRTRAGGDSADADAGSSDDAQRTSRGPRPSGGGQTRRRTRDSSAPAAPNDAGEAESGRKSDASDERGSDDSDQRSSRRRRRGRRGRGRGRGEKGGADAAPDAKDEQSESRSGGGEADAGSDAPSPPETDKGAAASDTEGEVEKAIARGGTRMAAKRGNRRPAGGGGGRRQQRVGGVPEEVRRAILEGPPRTMLVTAREDRTQIAVMEDRTVVEHYVTRKEDVTYVGNIYMARVQNVLPGMEAAFLDIGKGRNGVLYAGEVLYDELDLEEGEDQRIENVLKPGQKVLVQVTKDPMGTKGPRLTMHLSLAGRYMVLAPGSDLFGISRKLTDRERDRLRRLVKQVKLDDHGIIVRTAAEGASEEQITADLERLLAKWEAVEKAADGAKALTAVYEEPPLVVKVIRDNFGPEFERCIVDEERLYHQVRDYLAEVAPELLDKVELYGAPTADARARAAGAPSIEAGTDGDGAAGDPAEGGTAEGDTSEGDRAEAEDAEGDRAEGDAAEADRAEDDDTEGDRAEDDDTEGEAAEVADDAEGEAAEVADDAEVADADEADEADQPAAADGEVDLAAAAARREKLPPLFDAYDVADQLRKAMGTKVWLPSGGYLIVETTEAMKVIDVNTGKFTGGGDTNLEEIVLKTNLEAADEIVRQLRLRDIGGIIIIDFIDMLLKSNQEQVVRRLKRELLRDRTKTRVSEVSKLGLVQMTRKNVSQGLLESFSRPCETCDGQGVVSELD